MSLVLLLWSTLSAPAEACMNEMESARTQVARPAPISKRARAALAAQAEAEARQKLEAAALAEKTRLAREAAEAQAAAEAAAETQRLAALKVAEETRVRRFLLAALSLVGLVGSIPMFVESASRYRTALLGM